MANVEDVARLILDCVDEEFRRKANEDAAAMGQLAAAFGRGEVSVEQFDAELKRLSGTMAAELNSIYAAEHAMEEFARGADHAATSAGKAGVAAAGAGRGMGQMQQQIMAGSYALQDFTATSGDLGAKLNSVSNNLPTLLVGLGGLGTVLSVTATAAIAVYRNWDQITRAFESKNPFPEAEKSIGGMKDELKKAKDAMEELESNASLTNSELAKYNDLRARTAELEKKVADETERQARFKKALEGPSKEESDRAGANLKALDGEGRQVLDQLTKAATNRAEGRIRDMQEQGGRDIEAFDKMVREGRRTFQEGQEYRQFVGKGMEETAKRIRDGVKKQTEDLFDQFLQGSEKATDEVLNLTKGYGQVMDEFAGRVRANAPETKAQAAAKAAAEKAKPESMTPAADAAAQAADARDKALTDALEKAGREAEVQARKDLAAAQREKAFDLGVTRKQVGKQVAQEDAYIASRGLTQDATAMMARAFAARREGQTRMSPDQIFEAVRREVARELHRPQMDERGRLVDPNRGMGAEMTSDIATKVAAQAQSKLQREMTGLSGSNANNTQKLISISATMLGEVARLRQTAAHQSMQIDALSRGARSQSRTPMKR